MRTINQSSAAAQTHGTEPILALRVKWRAGSSTKVYADRSMGGWDGRVLQFGGIQSQKTTDEVGNVSSSGIVLSDYDGHLKHLIDNTDIEGTPVELLHYFAGEGGSPTIIFYGFVNGPVRWSEGERTLSFDIVSSVESNAVGYALKKGEFHVNNDVAADKPWPMCFGWPRFVPALLVQLTPNSTTEKHIDLAGKSILEKKLYGLKDLSVALKDIVIDYIPRIQSVLKTDDLDASEINLTKLDFIYLENNGSLPVEQVIELDINGVIFKGHGTIVDDSYAFAVTDANSPKWINLAIAHRNDKDPDYLNPKVLWIEDDQIDLANHYIYGNWVKKLTATGKEWEFKGTSENICVRQEGHKCWFKYPFKKAEWSNALYITMDGNLVWTPTNPTFYACPTKGEDGRIAEVRAISRTGLVIEIEDFFVNVKEKLRQRKHSEKDKTKNPYGSLKTELDLIQYLKGAFWSAPEGTVVRQWNPTNGDIYVANMFESEQVNGVFALREVDGVEVFTYIPKKYYEVELDRETNIAEPGPQKVTTVEFFRPLESYRLQGWKKEVIYVTLQSKIAPEGNVADVIETLIEDYTSLIAESSSFANVHSNVEDYPAHFAIAVRDDALDLVKRICWQARCAIIVDAEQVKLRYLSEEPGTVFTLNAAKTEFRTTNIVHGAIDEILTELVGHWKPDYSPEMVDDKFYNPQQSVRFQNNVDKYGHREQEFDFFIYNDKTLVGKTLFFWGHRFSNSFRRIEATTFTDAMGLEVFDAVNVSNSITSASPCIVEFMSHDVHNASIQLGMWTPELAGSTGQYEYAWLNDGSDTKPENPAELDEEIDYSVNYYREKKDIDEVMRELRKLESRTKKLGKILGRHPSNSDQYVVQILGDGKFEKKTEPDTIIYSPNPWEDVRPGDFVVIESGQDGVNYCDKLPFTPVFGELIANDKRDPETGRNLDGYWYHVKMIDLERGGLLIPDVDHKYTASPLRKLKADGTGEDEATEIKILAANFAEHVFPEAKRGFLPVGSRILLFHSSLLNDEDANEDFWYFFRDPNLSNFAFLDCGWLDLKFQRLIPDDEDSPINFDEPPLLMHRVKIENDTPAVVDPGCGENTIKVPFTVEVLDGKLRIYPVCLKVDDAGHVNFDESLMNGVGPGEEECGDPFTLTLAGLTDELVASQAGQPAGYLSDVLVVGAGDLWLDVVTLPLSPVVELYHIGPSAVDGPDEINCLEQVLGGTKVTFKTATYHSDERGHINGNFGNNDDFIIRIEPTDLWLEMVSGIDGGFESVDIQHIGPSFADEAFEFNFVDSIIKTGSETTAKGLLIEWYNEGLQHDARGHCLSELEQASPSTLSGSFYVPQYLKHLYDVDASLAPATGDLFQYSGTNWTKVATTDVTVVTDIQVDGTTRKLQKKTRSIKVIANAAESGWTDVHTGVACP